MNGGFLRGSSPINGPFSSKPCLISGGYTRKAKPRAQQVFFPHQTTTFHCCDWENSAKQDMHLRHSEYRYYCMYILMYVYIYIYRYYCMYVVCIMYNMFVCIYYIFYTLTKLHTCIFTDIYIYIYIHT